MATETVFQLSNPATWVPSIVAGGAGVYGLVRLLRRDKRSDKQDDQIDGAVSQVINTLREEVARLAARVTQLESAYIKCHQENERLRALINADEQTTAAAQLHGESNDG